MNRKPPASVIRQLRAEVGFGCPVPDCGNPYLEWHHFDPQWSVQEHHNPDGMIALCAEHHKKADNGAYTIEQLAGFKQSKADPDLVRGRFDWRRNKLLAFVGGNFYYETPRILVIDDQDVVSLTRDEHGYLLLNVNMLSIQPEERAVLRENCWENIGSPIDLVSPPSGKELTVSYSNGDYLSIKFSVVPDAASFINRFSRDTFDEIEFPVTVVEVNCRIGGTDIQLTPAGTTALTNQFIGCFMSHCGAGLVLGLGLPWQQNQQPVIPPQSRLAPCPCRSGKRYKHCHGSLA